MVVLDVLGIEAINASKSEKENRLKRTNKEELEEGEGDSRFALRQAHRPSMRARRSHLHLILAATDPQLR